MNQAQGAIDAARAAGADVLDLVPVFAAWKKPLGLWDEALIHYNARGYRLAADAIVGELMRLDHASATVDGGNENPQRSVPAAAEDFWIPVERVTLSMVRRATSYR